MPYLLPTETIIEQQMLADVLAQFPDAQPNFLDESVYGAIISALAEQMFITNGYIDWVALQSIPATATGNALEFWAALKSVIRDIATSAIGSIRYTGTASGILLPQGTQLVRQDGFIYTTNSDEYTDNSFVVSTNFTATQTGPLGNAPAGMSLTIQGGIAGIVSPANANVITGGASIQTDDSLRTEMLAAYSAPAQGGAATDYDNWALQSGAGVTRAWTLGYSPAPGMVAVYIMLDDAESANGGFPQGNSGVATAQAANNPVASGDQLAVANYIYPLRPVTSTPFIIAPQAQLINVSIANMTVNTSSVQLGIVTAIEDMFLAIGTPLGQTIELSDIYIAILSTPGIGRFNLVSPTTSIPISTGNLPVLGTTTFSS